MSVEFCWSSILLAHPLSLHLVVSLPQPLHYRHNGNSDSQRSKSSEPQVTWVVEAEYPQFKFELTGIEPSVRLLLIG
jgi:hypothetical protein